MNSETRAPALSVLPKDVIAGALLLLGFAAYLVWDQIYWWGEREDYSFGYLVPFFAAYVIYDRWPRIRAFFQRDGAGEGAASSRDGLVGLAEGLALAVFFGALLLYLVGALLRAITGPQNPASLALSGGFAGLMLATVFIFSKDPGGAPASLSERLKLTGLFLFPALIWLLSAPLVSVLETQIRVFLLTKVTIVVFNLFDILGYELQREGNILILPQGSVGVEEACSGIRSLTACLFAGSFLAAVFLDRFWKKVLLVGMAMVLAVITNLMRSLFLTYWAYHNGSGAIDEQWSLPLIGEIGTVHDVTGFAILGVTCLGLLLLLPVFNFRLAPLDDMDETADEDPGDGDEGAARPRE